jgi:hypothetical protein
MTKTKLFIFLAFFMIAHTCFGSRTRTPPDSTRTFCVYNADTIWNDGNKHRIEDGQVECYKRYYYSVESLDRIAVHAGKKPARSIEFYDNLFYKGQYKNGKKVGKWHYESLPGWSGYWCNLNSNRFIVSYSNDTVLVSSSYDTNFRIAYFNDSASISGSIPVCFGDNNYFDRTTVLVIEPNGTNELYKLWIVGKKDQSILISNSCLDLVIFTALNVFSWQDFVETMVWLCQENSTE